MSRLFHCTAIKPTQFYADKKTGARSGFSFWHLTKFKLKVKLNAYSLIIFYLLLRTLHQVRVLNYLIILQYLESMLGLHKQIQYSMRQTE